MAMLPENGVQGLMTGILGSASALAIAFPLALGGSVYDPAAATGAARTGFYATNGAGVESVHVVVGGVDGVNITHDSGTVDINVGGAVTAARIAAGGASTPITARTNQQLQSFGYAGNLNPNSTITGGSFGQMLGPKQCQAQFIGGDDNENAPANVTVMQYNITGGTGATHRGPQLYFIGSRATAANMNASAFAAVQSSDQIGSIFFGGDNGVNFRLFGAQILATASETWSSTTCGASIFFNVCPGGGSTSVVQVMQMTGTSVVHNVNTSISPTAGNAVLTINAPTGSTPQVQFQINAVNKVNITAQSSASFQFNDNANTTTPISYTAGAIGVGFVTFANTLDASSSTVAGHVLSGGLAVAKSVQVGTSITTVNGGITLNTTSGNAILAVNAATGSTPFLQFQINAAHLINISATSTSGINVADLTNSTTPLTYTPGAIGAGFWTFANTTSASSSSTGALVVSGGIGIAAACNVGGVVISGTGLECSSLRTSYLASGLVAFFRSGGTISPNSGDMVFQSDITGTNGFVWAAKATTANVMYLSGLGSLIVGVQAALATNATDGFLYVPTSAGAPTGTPTAFTGKVALEYDTTDNKLYVYNGAWKAVTLA